MRLQKKVGVFAIVSVYLGFKTLVSFRPRLIRVSSHAG